MKWSCKTAGKPMTFLFALALLTLWFITGLFIGFSTEWLLVIDTLATINASLMVFIIQNTQNRESKALHLKIDELLISAKESEKILVAIEEKEEEEIEEIRYALKRKRQDF